MTKSKVIIVATHPIQYHAPWYRELAKNTDLELLVLFGMIPNAAQQSTGFTTEFKWDIPLTNGYQWQLLENRAKYPNLSDFKGIDCPRVHKDLRRHSPDVIIITGWHSKLLLQAAFAAKRLGVKTIMRGDSNAKKKRNWKQKFGHRMLLKAFDAFLSVGKSNTQFFINNGVSEQIIFDAPYFIENQRFLDSLNNPLPTNYDIPSTSFCFVYAGKLIQKKNVLELLKAFSFLYRNNRDTHFLIIGDGELQNELVSFVEQGHLAVTFCGFVNQQDLPSTYTLGDCLLLGSDYDETWGLVVNEAMVCGLPAIVSSRAGSGDDLIIEGETGFIYEYGNTDELTSLMGYMADHPKEAKAMGKNAQRHILSKYHVDATVTATLQAISSFSNSR